MRELAKLHNSMSTTGIDGFSIPAPSEYSYPSGNLPEGLTQSPSSSSSSSSSSTSSTPATNPYVQEYDSLQSEDLQELFNVSFGTQQNAALNIDSVLAQWVAIDAQEQEAQAATIQNLLNTAANSTNDADANIPTAEEVESQSDAQAQTVLNNYSNGSPGSSILDAQA